MLGLALWWTTQEALLAIFLAIAADGLAGVPTIRKAYTHPETERPSAFLGGGASAAITLLTLDEWTLASASFAVYILAICGLLVVLASRQGKSRATSERQEKSPALP